MSTYDSSRAVGAAGRAGAKPAGAFSQTARRLGGGPQRPPPSSSSSAAAAAADGGGGGGGDGGGEESLLGAAGADEADTDLLGKRKRAVRKRFSQQVSTRAR